MHTKAVAFAALLAASLAPAQSAARPQAGKIFELTSKPNVQGLEEIGAILRTIGDIPQVSLDAAASTVTVQGTSDQLALSGWLIQTLDLSAGGRSARQPAFASTSSPATAWSAFFISPVPAPLSRCRKSWRYCARLLVYQMHLSTRRKMRWLWAAPLTRWRWWRS